MKRLICTVGVIGAGLCAYAAPAAAEEQCYDTPEAVLAAHPDAAHVRYTHRHRATRCWFPDDRADAEIRARPSEHRNAPRTAAHHPAIAPEPHTTAAAPRPDKTAAPAPDPVAVPTAPAFAVNPQELNRLLPAGNDDADFDSRFSASGMRK